MNHNVQHAQTGKYHIYQNLHKDSTQLTQPNANGRLFPVPNGTVAIGGDRDSLRSQTTPRSQPAVPSPPAT